MATARVASLTYRVLLTLTEEETWLVRRLCNTYALPPTGPMPEDWMMADGIRSVLDKAVSDAT